MVPIVESITKPGSATSQPCDTGVSLASEPCVARRRSGQGGVGATRGPGGGGGRAGQAPAAGPSGAVLQGAEARKHDSIPLSPTPPSSPGSGWGTPIVSLSGGEQTKKRLPGAAGRLTGPSSSPGAQTGGGIHGLSLPCSLGATRGFAERTATVKIAPAASIVPALICAAPGGYLSGPLWAGGREHNWRMWDSAPSSRRCFSGNDP